MSFKKFKAFFNKENYDYSNGEVDPYEFHKQFYILAKIFRIIGDEKLSKWTILAPITVIIFGTLAFILCVIGSVHYCLIFDIPLLAETVTYLIVMGYKLIIMSCTFTDKLYYKDLCNALKNDFKYICTEGDKYREKYFQMQKVTFQQTFVSSVIINTTGVGMIVCGIIALVVTLFLPELTAKPLPFPVWAFDYDLTKSPVYEIMFTFCILCIVSQCFAYNFLIQTQIIWIKQIMSRADIIIWHIEELLVDVKPSRNVMETEYYEKLLTPRLVNIVKMHQSLYSLLDSYAGVYRKLLMFEQKALAPLVCLTAFGAAEKYDNGEIPGLLIILCVGICVLLFLPCYMCTKLTEKIESIGDACWDTPFWNAPKVIRPYMVLIMQKSKRPLQIKAPGFEDVSLETYSDKIYFAYSCFNMLRKAEF